MYATVTFTKYQKKTQPFITGHPVRGVQEKELADQTALKNQLNATIGRLERAVMEQKEVNNSLGNTFLFFLHTRVVCPNFGHNALTS